MYFPPMRDRVASIGHENSGCCIKLPPVEILPGHLKDHRAQKEQSDQVGDGHEAIEGIRNGPGQGQIHGGADDDHQSRDASYFAAGTRDALSVQMIPAPPAHGVQQGKEAQADGDDQRAGLAAQHGTQSLRVENGLMAIPNLIGLLLLCPVVFKMTREYFDSERRLRK